MSLRRRELLAAAGLTAGMPRVLFAKAATHRRFVFVLLRGGADGLNIVIPRADPGYAALRGPIAIEDGLAIDGTFALHPQLASVRAMYQERQVLFVHAVASPYRDRSHFDGQNVLESGGAKPYQLKDGWLNRLVGMLPQAERKAIAFVPTVPLVLRGPLEVIAHAPSAAPAMKADLASRMQQLYAEDAQLHALWTAANAARDVAGKDADMSAAGKRQPPAALGRMVARFLSQPGGPRVAMVESIGWDTHAAQNVRLASQVRGLDEMLAALRQGLGTAWEDTLVLAATEFGRTAAVNGTGGTDHGTASIALLAGGAIEGGRVITDWPGLSAGDLYEARDLRPTMDLDALMATAAADCFGLDRERVMRVLFPHGSLGKPLGRLIRA